MKKILIINTSIDKGGAARVAYQLFKDLNSDFEMHFAYGRKSQKYMYNSFYFGNKLELFLHILMVRFLGLEGYGSYFSTKKLIRYIEKGDFSLINLHNMHGYYLNFPLLLKFLNTKKIDIIYSLHDEWSITWLPAHSMNCAHCLTAQGKCSNSYSYPKSYTHLPKSLLLYIKKKALSLHTNITVVCPSKWLSDRISQSYLGSLFDIKTIHNGVDTNTFKPTDNKERLRIKYNVPTDKIIITFLASNLSDRSKGIKQIIKSSKMLKNDGYFFLGIGHGNLPETKFLKSTGYVHDKNKLAELYALSDIFCFASVAETFLLSAAEAMSCGIPVVGFDIPVVRELINSQNGILTSPEAHSIVRAIKSLESDENNTMLISQCNRIKIVQNYSTKLFIDNYRNLYSELLKKKHD